MRSTRSRDLDIARGIAIVLVVIGHVVSTYHNSGLLKDEAWFRFVGNFVSSFHMPLFLLISGYLYAQSAKKNRPAAAQAKQKLLAYGVPYAAFSVVYWVLKSLASSVVNSKLSVRDLLMIPLKPISFMWFLYALLIMTLAALLLDKLKADRRIPLGISLIMLLIHPMLNARIDGFDQWIFSDVMRQSFYFFLGACFGAPILAWMRERMKPAALAGCLLGLAALNLLSFCCNFPGEVLLDIPTALLGLTAVIRISVLLGENQALELFGRWSLPIYLMHGAVLSVSRLVLERLGLHAHITHGAAQMLICTILGVGLPVVVYSICRKFRVLNFWFYPAQRG